MTLTRRARGVLLISVGLLVMASCAKKEEAAPPPPASSGTTAPSATSPPPISPAVSASSSASASPPVATGVVTLVLQHVSADCGGTGGWAGSKEGVHSLGIDVLLDVQRDDPSEKPHKEFAFCPSHLADGGPQKPQLSLWQYCRAFPSCREVSTDAGGYGRVEIQCGKENLVLESDEKRTILRGSFGEREIAPHPMRIAPLRREERHAMVDC